MQINGELFVFFIRLFVTLQREIKCIVMMENYLFFLFAYS